MASAIASADAKKPEVRVADVRPDAHVRLGDADQRADFPGVIHAQFDHRHVGPRTQLEQRERQADVVVQVAPCSETPCTSPTRNSAVSSFVVVLPALPVIATTFAPDRRRTSRARVLQRPGRVRHLDDERRRPCRSCLAARPASPSPPLRPHPRPARRRRTRARRTARRASRRTGPRRRSSASRSTTARSRVRASPGHHAPAGRGGDLGGAQRDRLGHPLRHPRAAAPARQRGARDLDVVERQRLVADHLVLLVPLAGDQDQIAAPRLADRPLDRLAAIDDRERRRALLPLRRRSDRPA